jgi:hypothetical protein
VAEPDDLWTAPVLDTAALAEEGDRDSGSVVGHCGNR